MVVELKSRSSTAKIDSKGAELVSLKDVFSTEYIWQKDPEFWGRSSPVLFPVVGGLRNDTVTVGGKEYHIPKHGFCRDAEFAVTNPTPSKAEFTYQFNDETLRMYPGKFSLTLSYTLTESRLTIRYIVRNLGGEKMVFCLGAHPAFNVPVDGGKFEDCCLEFDQRERGGCPPFDGGAGQFDMTRSVDYTGGGSRLMLEYAHFKNDALLFDAPNSNLVKLYNVKTGRGVEMDFESFDSVAFWTPGDKRSPFLCIEPWNGMAARSDEGNAFEEKRSARFLEPGEEMPFRLIISML